MWNDETCEWTRDENIELFFDHYLDEKTSVKYMGNKYYDHKNYYLSEDKKFLYIPEIWGFSHKDNISKYSDGFDRDSLKSTEISVTGYIDFFVHNLPNHIQDFTSIKFIKFDYVDRGIPSFRVFGNMLKDLFPNLEKLWISQNYSYCGENVSEKDLGNDYLYMLKLLKLKSFCLCSYQDTFLNCVTKEDILNSIENNSLYIHICKNMDKINDCVETLDSKTIVIYSDYSE